MIRRARCERCAQDALEVTDEYAAWEDQVEAEVLAWRCRERGDRGEDLMPLVAVGFDLVA